jgi:SET domain-containing protein
VTRARTAVESPIVVRKSAIQGRGVFTTRAIEKGERVVEYVGERITHEESEERYDDEEMRRHHTFVFSIDDKHCIDASVGGNEARFINHSCEPNAFTRVVRGRIFVMAGRDIAKGEEVLYDYWYSTDDSYTPDDLRRLYPCRCGVATCRGTLAAVVPKKPKKQKADGTPAAKRAHGSRNGSR